MYSKYALLFHLHNVWINESSMLHLAAVVAAHMQKLWQLKEAGQRAVCCSAA